MTRWKMCRRCGVKLTPDLSGDEKFDVFKCNVCGRLYTYENGKLEKYIRRKQVKVNFSKDLNEVLDQLEKKVRGL